MFDILLCILTAFSITYFAIPVIINIANNKKLYDIPDERKIHEQPIPSLAGVGIFAGTIMACMVFIPFAQAYEFQYFFAAFFVIFFLGLKDDVLVISPIKKFIGQVAAAFLVIYEGNIQIFSMHGFLGIHELPPLFSLIFTYLTVIVIINSFNLIDGIDGLAGSLGLMAAVVFGIYFYEVKMLPYSILAFSTAASLLAFLIFNFHPAKIFMGDTGSLLLGVINAILVIKFINVADLPSTGVHVSSAAAVGFAVLMIPLLDTLRVFAIRIANRRSPFSPDRNHIHHILLDRGFSHRNITFILVAINLVVLTVVYLLRSFDCTWLFLGMFGVFFSLIAMLYYGNRRKEFVLAKPSKEGVVGTPKIVSISKEQMADRQN